MRKDYEKFLLAKLYLIECISLKGKLNGDKTLSKIHDICLLMCPDNIEEQLRSIYK